MNYNFRLDLLNLKDISIPTEIPTAEITKKMKQQIDHGIYKIGELIVPQTFQKISIKNGQLTQEEIQVQGRKISLKDIRTDMLAKHKKFMRLRSDETLDELPRDRVVSELASLSEWSDEFSMLTTDVLTKKLKAYERTRNLITWHDGSSLSSHSHLLITVACLYDRAVFLTDEEYYQKEGVHVNVQAVVEKPFIHILARTPATDQQLLYSQDRLEDIFHLKTPIEVDGIYLHDILRAFKGDHPASQFEAGQQKGGNFVCHGCAIESNCHRNLPHSFKLPTLSLQDRINKIHTSLSSQNRLKKKVVKIYDNLDLADLIDEHQQRNIPTKTITKQYLRTSLNMEMHGIQRMPALFFNTPFASPDAINLSRYEILINEPLHDTSNHIKNIQEELPHHVPKEKKMDVKNIIAQSFNGKEAKNSADHRKSLLIITNWFIENLKDHFTTNILISLCEIQEILYLPDKNRSPLTILRLLLATFQHSMLLKIHISTSLKSMTERKFYGTYYHSLIRHSGEQYRIFSGRTSNTEKEEAIFQTLKKFTNLTSNHHPENVIYNALIRTQAESILKQNANELTQDETVFTNLYQPIEEKCKDFLVSFEWIITHYTAYQAFLEQIADFLILNKGCWKETNLGVVFLVNSQNNIGGKLHHFRSSSIKEVCTYVKNCWEKCLENAHVLIPAQKIKIYNTNDTTEIIKLSTLNYFNDNPFDEKSESTSVQNLCNEQILNTGIHINSNTSHSVTDFHVTTPVSDICHSTENSPDKKINNTFNDKDKSITHSSLTEDNKCQTHFLTSTPCTKTQYQKNGTDILYLNPIDTLDSKTSLFGKTSQYLIKLFGEKDFILQFDKARKKLKLDRCHTNVSIYRDCLANTEIKVVCEEEKLKKNLKEKEMEFLAKTDNSLRPSSTTSDTAREEYNILIKKLKYIKAIKREFTFNL